jgi:hypothetical protein
MTPLRALTSHKLDLRRRLRDSFAEALADRSICPDMHWCYRLFKKHEKAKCDASQSHLLVERVADERINKTEARLNEWVGGLRERLRKNPNILVPAVEHFLTGVRSIKEDSRLADVLLNQFCSVGDGCHRDVSNECKGTASDGFAVPLSSGCIEMITTSDDRTVLCEVPPTNDYVEVKSITNGTILDDVVTPSNTCVEMSVAGTGTASDGTFQSLSNNHAETNAELYWGMSKKQRLFLKMQGRRQLRINGITNEHDYSSPNPLRPPNKTSSFNLI